MTARKDNDIKKLAGTFRKHRELSPDFLELLTELPEPPTDLPAGAQDIWRELGPAVCAVGISSADLTAFKLLVSTLWTATEARQEVERDGYTVASGKFSSRAHPALATMQTARAQAQALLDRFGLTPRSRVGVAPKGPTSVFGRDGRAVVHGSEGDAAPNEFWARFREPS